LASPETVRLSLAAAMTLGFKRGKFYRDAKLGCINLLMEYEDGCIANCQYCGQGREIADTPDCKNLIRVSWPSYPLGEVIDAIRVASEKDPYVQRVCISALTRKQSAEDLLVILKELKKELSIEVSTLVTPTVFSKEDFQEMKDAGVGNITIAVDCSSEGLFHKYRGKEAKGPHKWGRYMDGIKEAVEVMGKDWNSVGVHQIIGLGETEEDAIKFMQEIYDLGARVHLFSFYPEKGSPLEELQQPPLDNYRHTQIARQLLDMGLCRADDMKFEGGKVVNFGISDDKLAEVISKGEAFETSGCPGCNRPFANETPSQAFKGLLRNYPFPPTEEDIKLVQSQF